MLVALGCCGGSQGQPAAQLLPNLATVCCLMGTDDLSRTSLLCSPVLSSTCPGLTMAQEPGRILLSLSVLHPVYS